MFPKCKKQATFSKSSSSKTSHCSTINSTSSTNPHALANTHRRWIQRQWNEVLFTGESRFNVDFADERLRVWRGRNERFDTEHIIQRDRYGGGSVMVWGGISHRGKTVLLVANGTLNSQRYCDEIMQESYSNTMPVSTQHVTHKPAFNKTILSLWIGLHDRQIYHQLSTFGTFLVVV